MVSVPVDLFIGLVTHPRTRFPESAGVEGLAYSLAREFASHGHEVHLVVFGEDAWTAEMLLIDSTQIESSIDAELDAESRWRIFQSPRTSRLALRAFMRARRVYRRRKFLRRGVPINQDHPGFRMVRRLINIETAHVTLLDQASALGCDWALILEDDATAAATDAAAVLEQLLKLISDESQPLYVNVSRSFGEDRLRVEKHLKDIGGLPDEAGSTRILAADRPFTNTVCAVLYRGTFLPTLVSAMNAIPMSPVIPIDWKLNSALLNLHDAGAFSPGDCWTLSPSPIIQGSMHS